MVNVSLFICHKKLAPIFIRLVLNIWLVSSRKLLLLKGFLYIVKKNDSKECLALSGSEC